MKYQYIIYGARRTFFKLFAFVAVAVLLASQQVAAFTENDFACQGDTTCFFKPCANPYALPPDQLDKVTECCPDGSSPA